MTPTRDVDFRTLEGIRGLAALAVVLNHARGYLFIGGNALFASATPYEKGVIGLFQITTLGLHAVVVFFVLSGFSIAHSLAREGAAGRFYLRRIVRLVPPAAAGLALALFAQWAMPQPIPLRGFIPQYWSLYQEAVFYVLAPAIALAGSRMWFATVAVAGYLIGTDVQAGGILRDFLFRYAIYFAVGVVAYHERHQLARLLLSRRSLLAVSLVAVVAMAASIRLAPRAGLMLSAAFALLLIANFQAHRLTNRALAWLGAMSYTLYVTHYSAIVILSLLLQRVGLMQQRNSASLWLWLLAPPFCLVVSWAAYLLVERPAVHVLMRMRRASERGNSCRGTTSAARLAHALGSCGRVEPPPLVGPE